MDDDGWETVNYSNKKAQKKQASKERKEKEAQTKKSEKEAEEKKLRDQREQFERQVKSLLCLLMSLLVLELNIHDFSHDKTM
jgi:hypothetical protein